MANLYNVDSPINREQRKNINDTFADILSRFTNLQMQINILSGATSVEEVLTELTEAINNANTTVSELQNMVVGSIEENETATQSAIDNLNAELAAQLVVIDARLTALQTAIDGAENATDNANTATANTTSAINDARQAITDINNLIASMSYKGEYNASTTYNSNNIVRYGKSSYVSLKTQTGAIPIDDGVNWRLVALGGIDGQGAVQTVNDKLPNEQGNVELGVPDIDGLEVTLNEKANDEDLIALEETVTQHLDETLDQLRSREINVKYPPPPLIGAKGDGTHDDTDAIQSIINLDKPIYVPPGIYKCSKTIFLKKNNVKGASPHRTVFDFINSSHGFTMENGTFLGRASVEIGGFQVVSTNNSCGDFYAFYCGGVAEGKDVEYNFGVNFTNIEVENFGGGFFFSDIFRLNVESIGMSNVTNAIHLKGSVVQATFDKITNNADQPPVSVLPNVGMKFSTKMYNTVIHMPESIKTTNCSFVKNHIGIDYQVGYFCTFNNIDLDFCKYYGVVIGNSCVFENAYIASDNTLNKFVGIKFDVNDNSKPYSKMVVGCKIHAYAVLHPESVAIEYGDGGKSPYREEWGGSIEKCSVTGVIGSWKHAIIADRNKSIMAIGNIVEKNVCSDEELVFTYSKFARVVGNIIPNGVIRIESPISEGFGEVVYNQATIIQSNMATPANWEIKNNFPI